LERQYSANFTQLKVFIIYNAAKKWSQRQPQGRCKHYSSLQVKMESWGGEKQVRLSCGAP